jgi:hypothetical protein
MSSSFFDNIFTETHPDLSDLQNHFEKLHIEYLSSLDINKREEQIELTHNEAEDSDHEFEILSNEQIENFKDIYYKNKITDDQIIDSEEQMEIDHDIKQHVENLLKRRCCQKECLKKKLDFDKIETRYKFFLDLRKTEQDMFLKGILSASLRDEVTAKGKKREKLANIYFFDGIEICKSAFLGVYGIGTTRWENIRNHFNDFDIQRRANSLTGKVSNRAVSFSGVLQIIKFILNYSNINGLPSPGKYKLLTNIKFCKQKFYN